MLFGDRAKYLMMICGITFATILMASSAALLCGLMSWTFASVRNVRAPIWVADSKVEQVNDTKPLRETDLNRVRSVDGVDWAVPLYQGLTQARLFNGAFQMITLVGIDQETLIGAPAKMISGNLQDLRLPNTVILDEFGVQRLSEETGRRVGIGEVFEINDREARVVGICRTYLSFTGGPYVFTTYDRAVSDYSPPQRRVLSFILAAPRLGLGAREVALRIDRETGLRAYPEQEFEWSTIWWYVHNTGIPINAGLSVLIGFIVGTVISAQTFYTFVLENTRALGALKAMGTSDRRLCAMLVLQSSAVGLIGYGVGMGVVAINGNVALRSGQIPFLMTWHIPVGVLAAVIFCCVFAALLGILRISRVDAASVFR